MIALLPTNPTITGSSPDTSAGNMNWVMITAANPRPTRPTKPRNRATATTATQNSATNTISGVLREKPENWYAPDPSGNGVRNIFTSVPGETPEAYCADVKITSTTWPFSGPSSTRTWAVAHTLSTPGTDPVWPSQECSSTATTVPVGMVRPST